MSVVQDPLFVYDANETYKDNLKRYSRWLRCEREYYVKYWGEEFVRISDYDCEQMFLEHIAKHSPIDLNIIDNIQ